MLGRLYPSSSSSSSSSSSFGLSVPVRDHQCATFKATPSVGMRLQELRALYRDKDNSYGNANVHYMLLRLFDTFDIDGDGFLSQEEIYSMKEGSGRRSFGRVWSEAEHEFFCKTRGYDPEQGVPCGGLVDMFGDDPVEAPNELVRGGAAPLVQLWFSAAARPAVCAAAALRCAALRCSALLCSVFS
jgi:hypothetical protein